MKYEYYPKRRTEQERRELNEQILRLLQSEACEQAGVTDEDIFNRYTGDGGLHGLRRSDYENYNAFSAAKKELENGQFFTPPPLCEMIVSALRLSDTDLAADLTCGMGNFFNFLPNERNAYGCEVDPNACAVARKLYPQAHIVQGDIRDYEPQTHFDFVLGNPPFHLRWIMPDATVMTSHQYYCLKAAKLLKPLGILAVIVPASFLADSFSDKGAIRMMESRFSFLGQVMLPEHAFSDSGVDGFPTKLQFWQKKSTAADWAPKRYSTDCSDIYIPSGHPVMAATALYEKFVMVAKADLAGNRNKVFLELAQLKTTKSTFLYQVKKYLYQIRSHPVTREKYDACFAYVHRFYTQRQPADMPYEEWQRVQLTEAKVLAYLKQALCRQNAKPERDEIRLVKQKYSFVYKAYSRKMAKLLTDEMRAPVPIYQAVLNDEPERFPGYERLLRRKRREYDNQEQPFSEMTENAQLADWIGRFQYWDAQNHAYIHLNPLQSHDVNLTLQKRYAFLQWEQGSGKTPAAIFTGKRRVEMGAVHSIWVISSAISIRNNWDVILKGAGFSYVFVERLTDLQRIRPGDFVILTLNKVSQYKKQIGRYIKQLGYKIQFIFDESDNISNPSSKQTLSVLSCFRRCKYKLLTTGTSTRNNISEFAPQLELLYNNSINMISWCRTLYSYDKRSADMEHKENPYYAMPIPAYKKGYRLFANSHLPEKITVFGVGQRNQDIYNADELDRLLGKTVITRTFEEVTGKDIRRIHQMPIPFLPEEREVYNIVLKEFYRIQREYYRGKYYTLTDQRIPYRRDKTEDERFFILTLFAIAHEIEAMGQYSGSLMRVQLAVGLPPAHFGVQAKRFINYFNGRGAVAFQFKGKPYAIFIENTACFPQSFSAAAATVKNLTSFPRALVVDIGGFTADYVRLRNGVPDMAACDSLENGVILLYNRICAKANAELDILLEESEIDRILCGEDQDAAPEVIALAEREAQEFINDLLSGLRERMLELKSGKVIFLGGGATLLRRQIEASGKTGQAIFVEDINANAKGYEYLYRLQHSGR